MEICTVLVPLRIQSSLKKRKEKGVTKRLIRLISRGWAYQTSLHKYFIRKGAKQKTDLWLKKAPRKDEPYNFSTILNSTISQNPRSGRFKLKHHIHIYFID